uniref:Secreted protein n=1 Tax=Steinernema glaseri TaxID=37863 RepID=A0A1I7ZUJ5_9BILA
MENLVCASMLARSSVIGLWRYIRLRVNDSWSFQYINHTDDLFPYVNNKQEAPVWLSSYCCCYCGKLAHAWDRAARVRWSGHLDSLLSTQTTLCWAESKKRADKRRSYPSPDKPLNCLCPLLRPPLSICAAETKRPAGAGGLRWFARGQQHLLLRRRPFVSLPFATAFDRLLCSPVRSDLRRSANFVAVSRAGSRWWHCCFSGYLRKRKEEYVLFKE